ncbi:MAG: phosphoglycerate dehydrogenase [Candidatus Omnitrophica bacterium]|nr:phosphoglycerate dehydrogenase [Candidatus Omnitrophota bacterium]
MIKVLITDPMTKEGLKILESEKELKVDVKSKLTPEQLKETIKGYDAIIVRSATKVTKEVIEASDKLRVIGRAGVGLDNVDVEAASKKGIIVLNAPAGNTISTAEHTIAMILSLSRNIPKADRSIKNGEWDRKRFMGVELYGKVLGIVGMGRIGTEVARRALSFQMKVMAYDPFLSADKAKQIGVELSDLEGLLKVSDYITVHTPLTEETRHIIAEAQFKIMKTGVRIINCARGGIIDEQALAKAVESGKVAGCALDVFENEPPKDFTLAKMDNVVITPHIGASTEEAQVSVSIDIAEIVLDVLLNRCIRNAVNMPCVDTELLKILQPYLTLSEKLGSLAAQLVEGHIKKVVIKYTGDITNYDTAPLTIAVLKGILTPILQETVNFVNAPMIARERGIKIDETKTAEIETFANLISVDIETDKTKLNVDGTLFTKTDSRIVRIGGFYVEAVPSGYMLVISNKDVPGIIGQIGTLLGKNGINIAGMSFGREKPGGKAVSVLNVDSVVPKEVLAKIRTADNIHDVKQVKL